MCNHNTLIPINKKWCFENQEIFECMDCGEIMKANGFRAYQCEMCDMFFTHKPYPYPDPDHPKHQNCTFCCDECAAEAYEEVWVNAQESRREYELYGYDMDSWYR